MTNTVTISEIVKPMERGQITIPVNIRKKLNITPKTWLWVKLAKGQILIKPVKKDSFSGLADYLKKSVSDSRAYWTKKDDLVLKQISQNSRKRLLRLLKETRGMWVKREDFGQKQKEQERKEFKSAKNMRKKW